MKHFLNFPGSDDTEYAGLIRSYWPSQLINEKNTDIKVDIALSFYPIFNGEIEKYYGVILNRQCTTEQILCVKEIKKLGKKIIYSLDDNLFEIPTYNKAFTYYDEEKQTNALAMILMADLVLVQSEHFKSFLINTFDITSDTIKVIENRIPKFIWNFNKTINLSETKPKILYTGSGSYLEDSKFLCPIIEQTSDDYTWIILGMGNKIVEHLTDSKASFFNVPWVPVKEYPEKLKELQPDLMLFPKLNNEFNKSRSSGKVFEASVLQCPIICSEFDDGWKEPYGFIHKKLIIEDWITEIKKILSDKQYYSEIVKKQNEQMKNMWLENYIDEYMNILKTI